MPDSGRGRQRRNWWSRRPVTERAALITVAGGVLAAVVGVLLTAFLQSGSTATPLTNPTVLASSHSVSPSTPNVCPTPQIRDDAALPPGWRIVGDVVVSAGTGGGFCITSPQIHWAGIFYPTTVCRYTVSLDGLITGANAGYGLGVAITFNKAGAPVGNALQYEVHPRGSSGNWGSGEHNVLYPQDEAWLHPAATDNGWHHLTAIVGSGGYHFSVDGSIVAEGAQVNPCGGVFLRVWDGAVASFRNIDIQPGG